MTKTETMKDLTKYFIDLSKCSEQQQKHIISLLPNHENEEDDELYEISDEYYVLVYICTRDGWEWIVGIDDYKEQKTELTYPEFIKLFEGGEGVRTELLPDVAYWRHRCLLAEKCLSVSPCDPDITDEQIKAHKDYNQYLETFGKKY